jgi:hypothetical protein
MGPQVRHVCEGMKHPAVSVAWAPVNASVFEQLRWSIHHDCRYRQDYACQGCGPPHNCSIHPCCWL